jgi:hypothetical protein
VKTARARAHAEGPVAIRCHPRAPVASEDLEEWLEDAVARVRADLTAPATVRFFRVTQCLPSGRELAGWLVEIDLGEDRPAADFDLYALIRDMRLLGLEPTLFGVPGRGAEPRQCAGCGDLVTRRRSN